jgi:1-acyl-sn-glycerol-3-phosphate acyltransferase
MATAAEHVAAEQPRRPLPAWPRSRSAVLLRALIQRALLIPLVRWLCRPLRVEGRGGVARLDGPAVFVANHASHADTALILAALPPRIRHRTAVAAAEDYFFNGRARGTAATLVIGAFPFPRRGTTGLARTQLHLDEGWSVLLFPEGTRSADGAVAPFKRGIGALAAAGATIVPVGIAGTRDVLPKGSRIPRQTPAAVVFGSPTRFDHAPPEEIAERLQRRVSRLRAAARLLQPRARRSAYDRVRSLACSRAGLALAFCWGLAEALVAPVVPDFAVVLLAVAAPRRAVWLALAATAGSVAGGAVAYALGAAGAGGWLLAHAPLVTDRMEPHALIEISRRGGAALLAQPWTGIPYKVFGYQAAPGGIGLASFIGWSVLGRGARLVASAVVFALPSAALHRRTATWVRRFYGLFAVTFAAIFFFGLARMVAFWS